MTQYGLHVRGIVAAEKGRGGTVAQVIDFDAYKRQHSFTGLLTAYLDHLRQEGIDQPVQATLSVGAVLTDLFRMTGTALPPEVERWLDSPL